MRSRSAASVSQESGLDRTLLAAECAADISRGSDLEGLSALGLVCTFFASCGRDRGSVNLIEIEGFVPISDTRLDSFRAELGGTLHRLLPYRRLRGAARAAAALARND